MIPLIPIYIPWIEPLHHYAPLIWLTGIIFLGLTRFTHQLARRWGKFYYILSAIIRPVGIFLIVLGWLAVDSYKPSFDLSETDLDYWLLYFGWNKTGGPQIMFWINLFCMLGLLLSFGFGLWAIITLGLRHSYLYRTLEDSLITHGPYSIVRHPQFLSAIGITFFYSVLFPAAEWGLWNVQTWIPTVSFANWVMFTFALWILAVIEDKELALHYGDKYTTYASQVPRLFPN
jgi:protein-S-isoprenylcysteine O-methyltransferase Ste14